MDFKSKSTLDCVGLYCPEPVFRTRLALDELDIDQVLEVIADDPAAEEDIKRLAKRLGHEIINFVIENEHVKFLIKKKR